MSFINPTAVDVARDDLAKATRRHRRWIWSWRLDLAGAATAAAVLIVDVAVGIPYWWVYFLLVTDATVCGALACYARHWMRRAERAVGRAARVLRRAEAAAYGPQDTIPEEYR